MVNVELLDDEVLEKILCNMGLEDDDWDNKPEKCQALLERVTIMSERQLFGRFLEWEGIVGYTDMIISAIDSIREATEDKGE